MNATKLILILIVGFVLFKTCPGPRDHQFALLHDKYPEASSVDDVQLDEAFDDVVDTLNRMGGEASGARPGHVRLIRFKNWELFSIGGSDTKTTFGILGKVFVL